MHSAFALTSVPVCAQLLHQSQDVADDAVADDAVQDAQLSYTGI